ncbi:MAG: trypsin-like serine protease [Mycobacterium sp.]
MRRTVVALLAAMTVVATSCTAPSSPPSEPRHSSPRAEKAPPSKSAVEVGPDPRVGAIFLGGPTMHTCTGSVLDSAAGDLILTAAHCMAGGVDASFVPAFANNAEPQDFWNIGEVYLDPRWVSDQDPLADFAIARVSRDGGDAIEALTGGGFTLGATPPVGTDVTVTGYAFGVGGVPIGCEAATAANVRGFPSLRCGGLVAGTSGSPWTTGSTALGIVGGLEGGGCLENVSYTPPFDDAIKRLLARAEASGPGDDPPAVFDDDC